MATPNPSNLAVDELPHPDDGIYLDDDLQGEAINAVARAQAVIELLRFALHERDESRRVMIDGHNICEAIDRELKLVGRIVSGEESAP